MKRISLCLMAVALAGSCCFAQSPTQPSTTPAAANPGYTITVAPPTSPVHLGSAIVISVTVTNISQGEIYWAFDRGKDTAYKAFKILLIKEDGNEAETTVFHRKITGRNRPEDPPEVESGSSIALPYPPGKMFTTTIDLTRLYQITEPGIYKVDVSRFEEVSKVAHHAKPITFQVVP